MRTIQELPPRHNEGGAPGDVMLTPSNTSEPGECLFEVGPQVVHVLDPD